MDDKNPTNLNRILFIFIHHNETNCPISRHDNFFSYYVREFKVSLESCIKVCEYTRITVVENMLFFIIRSYRTSRQIDLNFDSLGMGNLF